MEDFFVFGYGSLMWRPGFAYTERQIARVRGYHRALCVYSHVHRGTPERPGLVLGLDRGGSCRGILFRVAAEDRDDTIAYLRAREQVTSVYKETYLNAQAADGRNVTALSYIVDRNHIQYAGDLAREEVARFVAQGAGVSGANPDYVLATQAHLAELGIADPTLDWLAAQFANEAAR
jgi:glutathione-specific gamma-glutamylcyclotransferase